MVDSTERDLARYEEPHNSSRASREELPHYWPFLLRPEQAAAALQVGRTKVFSLMASGELSSVTIGRSRRIPRDSLVAYIASLQG